MPPEAARAARGRDVKADVDPRATEQPEQRYKPALWSGILEEWICTLNIERFREQLACTADERQRAILTHLLEEHVARLERSQRSGAL